jgi:solute carrier family 25 phosphate transporter 3
MLASSPPGAPALGSFPSALSVLAFTTTRVPTPLRSSSFAGSRLFGAADSSGSDWKRARRKSRDGDADIDADRLLGATDRLLRATRAAASAGGAAADATAKPRDGHASSRRLWCASALLAAGAALAPPPPAWAASSLSSDAATVRSRLQWEPTPVNKRTGVTVFDAERSGYNVRFVTYLSRFLLVFDPDCRQWWYQRAGDLPRTGNAQTIQQVRLEQFGAFSASVEVGLQEYRGPDGPRKLLQALVNRYCRSDASSSSGSTSGSSPNADASSGTASSSSSSSDDVQRQQRQQREIKEARRQIALLFSLMDQNQPVEDITRLLAAIDNGSVSSVKILDRGSGYAPGYGPPAVTFPPPGAGTDGYETATGRAILTPNGRILRIDLVNRGAGYKQPPIVTVSSPAAIRFGDVTTEGGGVCTATAQAFLFKSGVNKGRIERIQLVDSGGGYTSNEIIRVRISPPESSPQEGGITATATAVLEYEVSDILVVNNGTGYAVEKPFLVSVEPPPLTARVNMNDPMMARIISPDQPLPPTTVPTKEMLKKMPSINDPSSVAARASQEASRGGGGGCIGRACYDSPVVAIAYPRAEKDSYNAFRSDDEEIRLLRIENALESRSATSAPPARFVSGSSSGIDASDGSSYYPEYLDFAGGRSSSAQLLSLLPAGIGLEFDADRGRYQLAVDPTFDNAKIALLGESGVASRPAFDPDFGPRGRSPIERDMEIGLASYLRFVASGAICCSGVHLALTPIDVVKTKVQTDPQRYPGVLYSFRRVWKEQGMEGFFRGWAPTFLGFFVWGGISYALTEYLRRTAAAMSGTSASSLDVPVILASSAIASFFGSFILCPFEAVRIRSVAQPDYAPNIVLVLKRMVDEEGLSSLFSAVPAFLVKEIPFAMAKFTVFDLSTAWLYEQFPAATEDLQLSLLVSLAGGTLGGFAAAIVSNPADVTISEMKKAKSDLSPAAAATLVLEQGGPAALFRGLPLRLVFYALIVSLQFLVYDAVRFALGIGSDDLKLYLDVLGGALSESGGPA